MPDRDELDTLIDSELTRYAEPRSGLEQRVMAHVSAEVGRSRRRRILIAIAAPLAASLLLVAFLILGVPHSQPGQTAYTPTMKRVPEVIVPAPQAASELITSAHARNRNLRADRVRQNINARPKLDLFPTLQPLSEEEQAATRFGRDAPEADRKALVEARQRVDDPVEVTAIRIPPLPSSEQNQN